LRALFQRGFREPDVGDRPTGARGHGDRAVRRGDTGFEPGQLRLHLADPGELVVDVLQLRLERLELRYELLELGRQGASSGVVSGSS
jgi:hypothetical protein